MMLEKYTLASFIFIAVSLFLNFGITGVGQADDTPILSDTNDTVIKKWIRIMYFLPCLFSDAEKRLAENF